MTNEEKAREIAKRVSVDYGFGLNCDSSVECYDAAMEMAAWKDEQFDKAVAVIKALESLETKQREMVKTIGWLKSLCPQPKQEWSEEDEDMLNSCISSIEEAKENRYYYKETDGDTSYDREIAFLKSLRPVKQEWSEEDA